MAETEELPPVLWLFDGVCGFCDWSVQWFLDHDRRGWLYFAPAQSELAARLRDRHPEIPDELETMVVVESRDGTERVYLRAEAALRVVSELRAPWRWLGVLRFLPASLLDAAYRRFARNRYRWFGQLESCRIPRPAERARFLT